MPSSQILKYLTLFFGILCIGVCIFCVYLERNAFNETTEGKINMINFYLTIIDIITCVLLIIGVKLVRQVVSGPNNDLKHKSSLQLNYIFMIPWLVCLPLTIFNFTIPMRCVMDTFWSIVASMVICM